jgi:hypothetical protein
MGAYSSADRCHFIHWHWHWHCYRVCNFQTLYLLQGQICTPGWVGCSPGQAQKNTEYISDMHPTGSSPLQLTGTGHRDWLLTSLKTWSLYYFCCLLHLTHRQYLHVSWIPNDFSKSLIIKKKTKCYLFLRSYYNIFVTCLHLCSIYSLLIVSLTLI